jgi:predicted Zn-dependent protease
MLKQTRRSLAGRLALVALPLAAAGCATNPATGGTQLSLISENQEIAMGRDAAAEVDVSMGLYDDAALQAYVDSVGQVLAAASERPQLPWRFRVVDDPVINAFALPGGYIYLARGIMTHFNSEAELASVLGHEIGHVTARHSVEQISRAQLAGVALIAGSVFVPEIAQYSGILSQSLGLLFLKFGRDDEKESDGLGFRYMTRVGYDPEGAVSMFETLKRQRDAAGGNPIPEWASTHPDPGNRVEMAAARIDSAGITQGATRRDAYLSRIDGIVYGPNPRHGYFRDNVFLHPDLAFRIDFPEGWKNQNLPRAVVSLSPDEDAIIQLTISEESAPDVAANIFFAQDGIQRTGYASRQVNGLPAVIGSFRAQTRDAVLAGQVLFIQHRNVTYELIGYTSESRVRRYQDEFADALGTFKPLRDRRALAVEPKRIEIVELRNGMTIERFNQRYPSTVPMDELLLINGLAEGAVLTAGSHVKRVVGEGAPED